MTSHWGPKFPLSPLTSGLPLTRSGMGRTTKTIRPLSPFIQLQASCCTYRAERARIGDYELLVFDLPADRAGPAVIGWELFGPPRHQELIDHGDEQTFDDAKAAAERAFDKL